jgi:phage terminase large subunit-like protein
MRGKSKAELFASLSLDQQAKELAEFSDDQNNSLEFDWSFWGRPTQFAPPGDWSNWLVLAGRGFGKTRCGAEWVRANMCGDTPLTAGRSGWKHIALIAETAADARSVVVGDGKEPSNPTAGSGILQVHPKDFCPEYSVSKRRLTWPNGAIASIYNATEPEQLRGPEFQAAWLDETAKWQYQQSTWDMLEFGMRKGVNPQKCITTTPKPTMLLKQIIKDSGTIVTRGSTFDNVANLSGKFLERIRKKYEGTRLGRQELEAEVLEDMEGALWRRSVIENSRVELSQVPPLRRIVVAIDPAASSEENSNETGIICAGLGVDGDAYVLDDCSGVFAPMDWASEAIALYRARNADKIIAETNNGGDMVESTLRNVDANISFGRVWASKGKFTRAEPASALYEQGRVHHVGTFPELEQQMCSFTVAFDRKGAGYSPDHVDALVWALHELIIEGESGSFLWTSV